MNGQFRIPINKAVDLIYNYVTDVAEARTKTLGGTIAVDAFKGFFDTDREIFKGKMAWYCYNLDNSDYPELFLAFEENDQYSSNQGVEAPSKDVLSYPNQVFTYEGNESKEDIRELLENHRIEPSVDFNGDPQLSKSLVTNFVSNYKTHGLQSQSLFYQQKYPFAFFESVDDPDVNSLLAQEDISYIRYYFGYETGRLLNNIRIVLVGVDSSGRNIISYGDPSKVIILDDSWPPPPDN